MIFRHVPFYELLNTIFSMLKDVPNTYVYSKALAEDLVAGTVDDLPVIVLRPSIGKILSIGRILYN